MTDPHGPTDGRSTGDRPDGGTPPPPAEPTRLPGQPAYGGWASPPPPPPTGDAPTQPPPARPSEPTQGPPPQVGETLGHYRLDGRIDASAAALVFAATDQRLGRQVAVTVVLGHQTASAAFVERFGREAGMLARLDSPHVISVYDHGVERGWPWVATRYAAGGDLGRMIATRGPLPPGLAALVSAQVADGLADAHRVGVVHRDVRPATVLLRDERPDRMHAYLDVGLARAERAGTASPDGAGASTYLAPERVEGGRGEEASDVYAVGCLLWETLTGRPPFTGSDAEVAQAHRSAPVPQLPGADPLTHDLNRVLGRTLAKAPGDRYPSAVELRDDLRAIAGRQQTPSSPPPPPPPVAPTAGAPGGRAAGPRRRRTGLLVGAAAAVVLLLVLGGVAVAVLRGGDDGGGGGGGGGGPEPDTEAIDGDLDGNGFGDAWLSDGQFAPTYALASDGSRFAAPEEQRRAPAPGVVADADGDGVLEVVSVTGSPPNLSAEVLYQDGQRGASTVTVPQALYDQYIPAAVDVNGDGADDLAVLTVDRGGDSVTVSGSLNDGEGRFGTSETWVTLDIDGVDPQIAAGDFDDDGLDDLVVYSTVAEGEAFWLLRGGDDALQSGEQQLLDFRESDYFFGVIRAGDADGDGVDELVASNADGAMYVVKADGDTLEDPALWTLPGRDVDALGGVSDVDGDGLVDWVRIAADGDSTEVTVLLSTGEGFEPTDGFDVSAPTGFPGMFNQAGQN